MPRFRPTMFSRAASLALALLLTVTVAAASAQIVRPVCNVDNLCEVQVAPSDTPTAASTPTATSTPTPTSTEQPSRLLTGIGQIALTPDGFQQAAPATATPAPAPPHVGMTGVTGANGVTGALGAGGQVFAPSPTPCAFGQGEFDFCPTPTPTPCAAPTAAAAALDCGTGLTAVLSNAGSGPSTTTLPALYRLNLPSQPAATSEIQTALDRASNTKQDFLDVQTPEVSFEFPIEADANFYSDGYGDWVKDVVWDLKITVEACLTSDEAPAWSGATDLGTSCDPETDKVNFNRDWYSVAQWSNAQLPIIQNSQPLINEATVPLNIAQIQTPLRFHYVGSDYTCCTALDTETSPLNVTVLPAAMIQEKVSPFTIIYEPPGNASSGSISLAQTFTTTQSANASVEVDNTDKEDDWVQNQQDEGFTVTVPFVGGSSEGEGWKYSSSTKWDTSTTAFTGQQHSTQVSDSSAVGVASTYTLEVPKASQGSVIPGASGPYDGEPFWNDLIVVLVHPQYAIWDFNGTITMQLIGSDGTPAQPLLWPASVSDLDACLSSPSGTYVITTDHDTVTLDATECQALAALDPFFALGQSNTPDTQRATELALIQPYGIPGCDPSTGTPCSTDDLQLQLKQIVDQNFQVTTTAQTTYKSSVDTTVSLETTQGQSFTGNVAKVLGLTFGGSSSQGSSSDVGQALNIVYSNSTVTSDHTTVTVQGIIDDVTQLGYTPVVSVYLDNAFGTLMFRDPDARCASTPPLSAVCADTSVRTNLNNSKAAP